MVPSIARVQIPFPLQFGFTTLPHIMSCHLSSPHIHISIHTINHCKPLDVPLLWLSLSALPLPSTYTPGPGLVKIYSLTWVLLLKGVSPDLARN